MRCQRPLMLLVLLLSGLFLSADARSETWVDATGKFRVEAKFLSVSGGNIYLETADGKRIAVPISRLSSESLDQAKRLYQAAKSAGTATPAAAASPATANVAGESKLGANPTAAETAEIMTAALAEFDLVTIWDAFPAKHQNDIEQTVRLAANSLDEPTWNSVATLLKKVSRLASDKKQFFLNNPLIGQSIPNTPQTSEIWDAAAGLIDAYANSTITDQSAMKSFSMDQLIVKDVPKMRAAFEQLKRLTQDLQDSPFGQMAEMPKIETVSESATEAVLKITHGEEVQEQKFVKFENRWVPAEMIEGWDEGMQKARKELAKLSTPQGQQGLAQLRMGLMMAGAPIDQLLAASDQAQFDAVIGNVSGMVMGMMGGMGGAGGPGIGGPGIGGPGGAGGFPPGFGGDDAPPGGAPANFGDGF